MNLFELVLKQMRQRALSTWLTLLSVLLGVGLAIAIMIMQREAGALFGQSDFGFDLIVGKKGSPLQLTLNTVYHIDVSPGNIPWSMYTDLLTKYRPDVKIAVPCCVGDTYQGKYRIVGTMPKYFGVNDDTGEPLPPEKVLGYRYHRYFQMAQGRVFAPMKFEAIIGSDVAAQTGLTIGSTFQATHGLLPPKPGEQPDIHPEVWTVVGILEKTHTANDRVLFIPIKTFYTIGEHSRGLKAHFYILHHMKMPEMDDEDHIPVYTLNPDKTINLLVPPEYWEVSSVLVETRSAIGNQDLQYTLNNDVNVMAVNPAGVMKQFFDTFLATSTDLLLVISSLVTVVAAVSILVSIYNSVAARKKEIAILRALGATKQRVMTLICVEAGIIGLVGGLLGLLGGHLLAAAGSIYFQQVLGESINWLNVGWGEWVYLAAVIVLALLAGLVPALKAYSTPVATNLVAS